MSEIYSNVLQELKNVEGVKTISLGSRDGFLIESDGFESEVLTLMSATLLSAAESVTCRIQKARPNHVIVDFSGGRLIAAPAGAKALISVVVEHDANLEPIISELARATWKIKEIL